MATIRCTRKLLDILPFHHSIDEYPVDTLGDWHANIILIERRKCLLFTHDATLFTLFVPGLRKPDFANLPEIFGQRLFKTMLIEGFSQAHIEVMLSRVSTITFTRTNSRRVLGSMNDLVNQVHSHVDFSGGLAHLDPGELARSLNHVPLSLIGYGYAVEKLLDLLAAQE